MSVGYVIGKQLSGNSATAQEQREKKTEARLLWEIRQHKKLEERTYAVLSFLAAVFGDIASCDDDVTLNPEARLGLQYVIQDMQGRLSRSCFAWMGERNWCGEFLSDNFSVIEYEPETDQGACHE